MNVRRRFRPCSFFSAVSPFLVCLVTPFMLGCTTVKPSFTLGGQAKEGRDHVMILALSLDGQADVEQIMEILAYRFSEELIAHDFGAQDCSLVRIPSDTLEAAIAKKALFADPSFIGQITIPEILISEGDYSGYDPASGFPRNRKCLFLGRSLYDLYVPEELIPVVQGWIDDSWFPDRKPVLHPYRHDVFDGALGAPTVVRLNIEEPVPLSPNDTFLWALPCDRLSITDLANKVEHSDGLTIIEDYQAGPSAFGFSPQRSTTIPMPCDLNYEMLDPNSLYFYAAEAKDDTCLKGETLLPWAVCFLSDAELRRVQAIIDQEKGLQVDRTRYLPDITTVSNYLNLKGASPEEGGGYEVVFIGIKPGRSYMIAAIDQKSSRKMRAWASSDGRNDVGEREKIVRYLASLMSELTFQPMKKRTAGDKAEAKFPLSPSSPSDMRQLATGNYLIRVNDFDGNPESYIFVPFGSERQFELVEVVSRTDKLWELVGSQP